MLFVLQNRIQLGVSVCSVLLGSLRPPRRSCLYCNASPLPLPPPARLSEGDPLAEANSLPPLATPLSGVTRGRYSFGSLSAHARCQPTFANLIRFRQPSRCISAPRPKLDPKSCSSVSTATPHRPPAPFAEHIRLPLRFCKFGRLTRWPQLRHSFSFHSLAARLPTLRPIPRLIEGWAAAAPLLPKGPRVQAA